MDAIRLRTAAGDAARSAQSVLRAAAANPERLAAELNDHAELLQAEMFGNDWSPQSLHAMARDYVLMAVACMDAARQLESRGGAA